MKNVKKLKPGISVCIIALNEEKRISPCLESVGFADEIIVVDGGSADATVKTAKQFKAKVFLRPFDHFVNQKNYAVSLAGREWVLVADADEVVTPELKQEILTLTADQKHLSEKPCSAWRIPRRNFYMGQWIMHGGWYPDFSIRLFRNGSGEFTGGTVHETFRLYEGSYCTLKNDLLHYSYRTISEHLSRIDQYSTLIAQDKFRRGRRSSVLWAVMKGLSKFFIMYIIKMGFLDGRAGLALAATGGFYNFLKYIKLWELNQGLREIQDPHVRRAPEV